MTQCDLDICETKLPTVIIHARLSSTRLPGKVLLPIQGREMLLHQIDRIKLCRNVGPIIVATSDCCADDAIAMICEQEGIRHFRGSLDDVAGRMLSTADSVDAKAFVRLSGDSPFIDPKLVDVLSSIFQITQCDIATNVQLRTFPKGQSVEVVSVKALRKVYKNLDASDREHVTTYFYRHTNDHTIVNITSGEDMGEVQLSVDTPQEFVMAERLIATLPYPLAITGWKELAELHLDLEQNG